MSESIFTLIGRQTRDIVSGKLDVAGGSMSGSLTLLNAPTDAQHAVTKGYVDNIESSAASRHVKEFYAFYVKQTTSSTGIEQWFGAIDAIDHMNYRVNTSVADIKLQNTGNIPLVISGARIFRDNGTSILHADLNDQPMTQDNGELIQYIKGQVDESLNNQLPPAVASAINSNATISGIDKNTKLIPALL